jgi:hypothetical protein
MVTMHGVEAVPVQARRPAAKVGAREIARAAHAAPEVPQMGLKSVCEKIAGCGKRAMLGPPHPAPSADGLKKTPAAAHPLRFRGPMDPIGILKSDSPKEERAGLSRRLLKLYRLPGTLRLFTPKPVWQPSFSPVPNLRFFHPAPTSLPCGNC